MMTNTKASAKFVKLLEMGVVSMRLQVDLKILGTLSEMTNFPILISPEYEDNSKNDAHH